MILKNQIKSIASVIITILYLFNTAISYSQEKNNQSTNITVDYHNTTLKKVLKDIGTKSGIKFSYSSKIVPAGKLITYTAVNKNVEVILSEILTPLFVSFELIETHMVLNKMEEIPYEPEPIPEEKLYTLNGFVFDALSKEALIGAAVFVTGTSKGAITNKYGFYSLTLPDDEYDISVSYLGYQLHSFLVSLSQNKKQNFTLDPIVSEMKEIIVSSVEKEDFIATVNAARSQINPLQVRQQASTVGESDVIRSLGNLPGINFQSDMSGFFYVRGGNKDQNLVLLDEATLYNPVHLFGLFSPIMPEAIKQTNVYKANFPIEYGGRLSSIVEIHTRDGNKSHFSAAGSMGLLATRGSLEGPIIKNKSSYFASFRQSYFGTYLKKIAPTISDARFGDLTTKFNFNFGKRDRLYFTFYTSNDILMQNEDSETSGIQWSNQSLTLRWNHVFGDKLFTNTTIYGSNYDYKLYTSAAKNDYWNSFIGNTSIKTEATYFPSPNFKTKAGFKLASYKFNPGNYSDSTVSDLLKVSRTNSIELLAYVGAEQKLSSRIFVDYGARLSNWSNYGEAFVTYYTNYEADSTSLYQSGEQYFSEWMLEPRISLSVKLAKYSVLRLSYNRTVQHINLISNSIAPINSLEVWLPSGPNIKPKKADIYNLGFAQKLINKKIHFGFDIFYKNIFNEIGYAYHAQMLLNPYIEGEIRQGKSRSYGIETYFNKSKGKFTWQLSYTWLRSFVQIDELNFGREYPSLQDRPHDFSLVANYQLRPRWRINLTTTYLSGMRVTTPTSFYYYQGKQVPIYTKQNNQRLPAFRKTDISMDFQLHKNTESSYRHYLTVSVHNIFGRKNAMYLNFSKTYDEKSNSYLIPADHLNPEIQTATYRYSMMVIPSINYYFEF
ncbi:MAG: TonB-dependent receptor [Bacteroidales bacterium]|nr:TonB-dependent receptor [Bacteroidales bacterium]